MLRLQYVINMNDYNDGGVFTVCRKDKKVILDVARPDLEGGSSIMRGWKLNGNKGAYCWENRLW